MKYVCLAYEEESKLNSLTKSEWDSLRNETIAYVDELRRQPLSRYYPLDAGGFPAVSCFPKIILRLEIEPKLSINTESLLQTQGHFSAYARGFVDYLGQVFTAHPQFVSSFSDGNTDLF